MQINDLKTIALVDGRGNYEVLLWARIGANFANPFYLRELRVLGEKKVVPVSALQYYTKFGPELLGQYENLNSELGFTILYTMLNYRNFKL